MGILEKESRVTITRVGLGVVWDKWGDTSQMVQTLCYKMNYKFLDLMFGMVTIISITVLYI